MRKTNGLFFLTIASQNQTKRETEKKTKKREEAKMIDKKEKIDILVTRTDR